MVEATRSAARGLEAADLATTAGLRGLSVIKTRPPVRSTSWSEPEGVLRRLRPAVPVVKTADTRQSEDPGGRGGPGLDWAAIW